MFASVPSIALDRNNVGRYCISPLFLSREPTYFTSMSLWEFKVWKKSFAYITSLKHTNVLLQAANTCTHKFVYSYQRFVVISIWGYTFIYWNIVFLSILKRSWLQSQWTHWRLTWGSKPRPAQGRVFDTNRICVLPNDGKIGQMAQPVFQN